MKKLPGLFLSLVLLSACGQSVTETMLENAADNKADIDMNNDGSMKIESSEGTVEWGRGSVPADWPSDVMVVSDANITYSASVNPQTGKPGSMVMFTTKMSAQAVVDAYKADFAKNGWEILGTSQMSGSMTIVAVKGDRGASLMVASDNGTTMVTVAVGEK